MMDVAQLGLEIRSDGVVVANDRLRRFQDEGRKAETVADKAAGAVKRMALQFALAAASAVSFGSALRAFAEFERGLIGIGKTADISGAQLRALGADIQVIAREVPIATTELLGIAMAAGQLGVSGSDNILRFTETVGKLGLASDLAGESAATTLARILTVTGTAIRDVDRLGSTIVQLGNNFAATESEIASATTRVAQATAQFNVAASEVTGIGAALTAVGVQAEAGGTVIGRAFQSINDAVRQGGEELTAFTRITGLSADALKNLFLEDPTAAFQSLIEGLGRINASGGDVTAALEAVGLEGVRVIQVLGTLATRSDVLADALAMANAEWIDNAALNTEAAVAAEAFTAQTQLLLNAVNEAAVALGAMIAPGVLVGVQGLTQVFQVLADNMERVAVYAGTAAVAGMIALRGAILAAATAAWGFVTALVATRAAMMRTGVGALVVLVGELIYQFIELVDRTGSVGAAFVEVGRIGLDVWNRIMLGAQAMGKYLDGVALTIEGGFIRAFANAASAFADFVATVAPGLAAVGIELDTAGTADYARSQHLRAAGREAGATLAFHQSQQLLNEALATTAERMDDIGTGAAWEDMEGFSGAVETATTNLAGPGGLIDAADAAGATVTDTYAEIVRGAEQFIAAQELERRALFMTEEAANALRFEQDMLNQAANDNIALTAAQRSQIAGLAKEMASAQAETDGLARRMDQLASAAQTALGSIMDFTGLGGTPIGAGISGAMGSLMRGDWIGALIGGVTGLFTGFMQAAKKAQEAREALAAASDDINAFFRESVGDSLSDAEQAMARFAKRGEQFIELAKAAGDTALVARIQDAIVAYSQTLALAAETAAQDARIAAVNAQAVAQVKAANDNLARARQDLMSSYRDERSVLEQIANGARRAVSSLRDFRNALMLDTALSPLSPLDRFFEAQRQFQEVSQAALAGDADAMADLESVSRQYLDEARGYYASSESYFRIFETVQSVLDQALGKAQDQVTVAEQQLAALDMQVGALIDINTSVLSVVDAIRNLDLAQSAVNAANEAAGKTGAVTDSTVAQLYQSILGRPGQQFEIDYWTGTGKTLAQIRADMAWAKAHGGMADGGWVTGGMPGRDSVLRNLMPGEFVMPTEPARRFAPQLEQMRSGTFANDNGEVVRELRELRAEVASLKAVAATGSQANAEASRETANAVRSQTNELRRVSGARRG